MCEMGGNHCRRQRAQIRGKTSKREHSLLRYSTFAAKILWLRVLETAQTFGQILKAQAVLWNRGVIRNDKVVWMRIDAIGVEFVFRDSHGIRMRPVANHFAMSRNFARQPPNRIRLH